MGCWEFHAKFCCILFLIYKHLLLTQQSLSAAFLKEIINSSLIFFSFVVIETSSKYLFFFIKNVTEQKNQERSNKIINEYNWREAVQSKKNSQRSRYFSRYYSPIFSQWPSLLLGSAGACRLNAWASDDKKCKSILIKCNKSRKAEAER